MKKAGDRKAYVNKLYDQALTLELVEWLGGICKLPVVVKGVLREEDAVLAAAMPNVRGVVVSNHGGRQVWMNNNAMLMLIINRLPLR